MLYLTEGDYINAGLSALSIIPGADAFTKTGKASKVLGNGIVESGLKHLDNVADGIKKLVKKADDAIDLEKHLPKKLLTEEAETFAKKADKVVDDVVEDAAKAIKIREDINMSQFLICKTEKDLSNYGKKIDDTILNYDLFSKVINQYAMNEKADAIWIIENIHEMVNQLQKHMEIIEEIISKSDVMIFWYGSDFQELEVVNSRCELVDYLKNNVDNPCFEIDLYADFNEDK